MDPIKRLLQTKSSEEKILEYLTSEAGAVILSPEEQELMDMTSFCDDQLRRLMKPKEVAMMLRKKFGIGEAKAYQVIAKTQVIYGTKSHQSKEYWRSVLVDCLTQDLQRARENGDTKAANGYYDKLIKIKGLDRDDASGPPAPPPPSVVVIQFNPQLLGVEVDDNIEKRVAQYLDEPYTDYQDVNDGDA